MEEKSKESGKSTNGFAERMQDYSGFRVYRNGKLISAVTPPKKDAPENNTK